MRRRVLLDEVTTALPSPRARFAFNLALFAILILGQARPSNVLPLYTSGPDRNSGYMNIGLWARDRFPPGTVIGSSQTGALGYFADRLKVINLDGVVNRECFLCTARAPLFRIPPPRQGGVRPWLGCQHPLPAHHVPGLA